MSDIAIASSEPRYAELLPRLGAMLIDLVIGWIALAIAANVLEPSALSDNATQHQKTALGVIALGVVTLWFNYLVVGEWRWGQTLGKAAVGIRVVGEDGRGLTWNRAVGRNLLLAVDFVLGLFMIPLSERGQRLGDRAAHTLVLAKPKPEAASVVPSPPRTPEPNAPLPGLDPAPSGASIPPPAASAPPPGAEGKLSPASSPTWGPGRVAVGILALLLTTVFEAGIVSAFDPDLKSLGARLVLQALLAVTLIGVAFAVSAESGGVARPQAFGLRRPLRSPFGVAAAAYALYFIFAIVYSLLVHPHQKDVTRDLGLGHGNWGTVAAGVLIVVAAPISEEIFFRGFIFGGLRGRLHFWVAAGISAGIFGLFHYTGPGSLGVLPQLAVLGFALCWVYERTGSIYPTMAMHALNNALAFAILTS